MGKYFKFLGIAFMATAFCMGFASCGDKDDNSTSGAGGITPSGYVDLGLPSGTKWKVDNETNPNDEYNFYTYDEALESFVDKLPTKEQFEELKDCCQWSWNGGGYRVKGRNGNSITLPAAGRRKCDWEVSNVGSLGGYWSSTSNGSDNAWALGFNSDEINVANNGRCYGRSVRLVKD